ncbi:MAG: tetratricopeptide repeat protein [Kofleriaceae bacterium]
MLRASRWLAVLLLCLPGAAGAEDLDKKLAAYEAEARQIGSNLPQPGQTPGPANQRRLVDAEVAYSLGDYDTAALMLFELSSRPGPDQETALYYLAESLFQKGDKGAARTYFEQIKNPSSKYYQPSLLRLVEISIAQSDPSGIEPVMQALASASPQLPEVPYVRGKLAFSQGNHDEAVSHFAQVPKGSDHELQAAYYTATALVAKKDVVRATEIFEDLIQRKPRTMNDRRVIELSQMALGRLYYERDQLAKSIDSYLLVDRRSDLFPDALYEVSWVYVKGKQYDKALRALELLALSDPTSTKTPTVRILEGNLRIRKAQLIRQKQIAGTLEKDSESDPEVEYDKASQVFTETNDMYLPSYQALAQMVESNGDPAQYLAQIAGRSPTVFQATAPIPEAAAQYLREEPEVQRVVNVESDLQEIETNLEQSAAILARLEGVLAAGDRTAMYPALQSRRARIGEIQDDLIKLRGDLAEQQLKLVAPGGASANRRALAEQYLAMPSAERAHAEQVQDAHKQYDAIEQATAEVSGTIDSTQAIAVALRKYATDPPAEGAEPVAADQKQSIATTLDAAAGDAAAIERELAEIQREIELGRDLAGVGDEGVAKAREARKQVVSSLDAEQQALAAAAGSSRDKGKSQRLVALGDRAAKLSASLSQIDGQIDGLVDRGMQQVKLAIDAERANVAAYQAELAREEAESRSIGGTVLGASFRDVKAKFYDIVIRTDVGSVDVSWSQKEDADDDLKRLNLSRQRDLKSLKDEFKGIIDGGEKPKAAPPVSPTPSGEPAKSSSPDKGSPSERIKPGSDAPAAAPTPTVRPDNETQPKSQPQGGTAKAGTK